MRENKMTLNKYKRDKEAKIQRITSITKNLIEKKGYNNVSIRDIVKEADVSIGLIYKYFPKGKIDIIKHLSSQNVVDVFQINHQDKIDFEDFPGYMKETITKMFELHKKNIKLVKAFTIAALMEDTILEDIKTIDAEDYIIVSEFFNRFEGVKISNTDSVKVFTEWSITIKSLIFHSSVFPTIFNDDESLINMLVDISLKIWSYKP
jgi:AcrR family transcriptional regulator